MSSKTPRRIDARATRTRNALARALVTLGPRRGVDTLKVEELARTAGIGRSTFYAHFAGKGDFLTTSFVGMIDACEAAAAGDPARADPLPTRQLFAHVHGAGAFATAILRSREFPRVPARREAAVFLAGGLMGMLRWWMEGGLRQDPEQLHQTFTAFARRLVAA